MLDSTISFLKIQISMHAINRRSSTEGASADKEN
jgi:hypothetical protein